MTYSPLVGALIILFWVNAPANAVRWIALIAASVSLVFSLIMLAMFDRSDSGMQLVETFRWLPDVGIEYYLGVDGISVPLVILTTMLVVIAILASWDAIQHRVREYMIVMLLLATGMIGVFVSLNLFLFYIFWEVVLIPMALMIGIWGSANRIYAAVKFFLYTLAGSLLMLVAIVATYQSYFEQTGERTLSVLQLSQGDYGTNFQMWVFLAFFFAFAIKIPLWPFHTWLPDAHVEAPTAGSVLLAGVLLKMGGYGLMRFNLPMFPDAAEAFAPLIIVLSVIAIIYGALVALVQTDLKKLIAYSSVSHMGFVTLGIFAFNAQGMYGAMIVMISHGLVTGALFLLVGVVYHRAHTRAIEKFGGLATNMPIYASFFGLFMFASLGLPGLSGFVGEFLAILAAFREYQLAGIISMAVVVLSAWYMMWMFQRVVWQRAPGEPPDHDDPELKLTGDEAPPKVAGGSGDHHHEDVDPRTLSDVNAKEILTLLPLAILTIWIGVHPGPFMELMQPALEALLEPFGGSGF